jgi:hypothetical protein
MNKSQEILEKIINIEIKEDVCAILLPHQVVHTQNLIYAIETNGIALDCADTGTGKSYSAVAVCKNKGLRPFFMGPKAGIPNLYRACEEFDIEPLGNVNYETIKNGKYYSCLEDFHCEERSPCPYVEVIREQEKNPITKKLLFTKTGYPKMTIKKIIWKLPPNTLIVFDEAHKCRNGKTSGKETGNSKLMISIKSFINKTQGIYGLFLSATLTDKLENFDVIAYMLGFYKPYQPKIYKQFLRRLGGSPSEIFKKIHHLLFPKYASRMSIRTIKEDTGDTIFKNNDIQAVMFPVDMQTALEIEETHQKIKEALKEIRSHGISRGWGAIIRYWQRIEVLKVPSVIDTIVSYLQQGSAVIIFVNFTETKYLLVDHILNHPANVGESLIKMERIDYIHGDQNGLQRQEIVDSFQKNEIDLLVCQILAAGIALSLHDLHGKQRKSIIFPTWSATGLKQALGRSYRAMAKTDSVQRIVYCKYTENTIIHDELIEVNTLDIELRDNTPILPDGPDFSEIPGEGKNTLSIEEMLCNNVNSKLENIEWLNNGNLLGLQKIEIPDIDNLLLDSKTM